MEIRNLIVKEYLESLTEKDELNKIFPILLEAQGFEILTKPTENLGLKEYGKDIVAIGVDSEDNVKKRFFFELKGGKDRDITEEKFNAADGIASSLLDAFYVPYVSQYPKYETLPLKIIIVHNGIAKGNVSQLMNNMFLRMSGTTINSTFDRWDISRLTKIFTENLFNAYLLTDDVNVRLFNKTLINLDADEHVSVEFVKLLENLLSVFQFDKKKLRTNRNNQMIFETFKLISFIVFTESKRYNNLNIAKKYVLCLLIKVWHWTLKNKLEENKFALKYFEQLYQFYFNEVLLDYFEKTLPIALKKDGLYFENGGMYEEIGYNLRSFDFLEFYVIYIKYCLTSNNNIYNKEGTRLMLAEIINQNRVCMKPLLDYHSNIICSVINLFIELDDLESARNYLRVTINNLRRRKADNNFLPDANNSIENVIKFKMTGTKPIFYSDSTSPLLATIFIYIAILNLEKEYKELREFVLQKQIDLGYFVPHFGINSISKHLIEDVENDFEEQLFSKPFFNEGYQRDLSLKKIDYSNFNMNGDLSFDEFKKYVLSSKNEFEYSYRTDNAEFPLMKDLAHVYFLIPYFPDTWKVHVEKLIV